MAATPVVSVAHESGGGQLGDLRGRRTPDMPDITAMEGGKAT